MWKKITMIGLLLVILFACTKKENQTIEPVVITDSRFFPVPEFSVLFATIENLHAVDFSKAIPENLKSDITDVYVSSFYLGILTADAIIATKAKNKVKLQSIAEAMIENSKIIGLSDEILMLSDELMVLIQEDKWDELLSSLDEYKEMIELSLYETRQLDLMTMVQAGGWTEGINIMSLLLDENYDKLTTSMLNQKGIVDNIVKNFEQLENKELYEVDWVKTMIHGFKQIYGLVNVTGKEVFTHAEVKELNNITNTIKKFL